MKKLFILLLGLSLFSFANEIKQRTGVILEHIQSGGYSYIKLKEATETNWVALPTSKVKINDTITIKEQVWMTNFESKTLNKTFDKILFATSDVNPYSKNDAQQEQTAFPASLAETIKLHKPEAKADNSKAVKTSIVAIKNDTKKFDQKTVTVKGSVTKVLRGIMKSSWIHVQDEKTQDTLIFRSTNENVELGDVVNATGIVNTNVDYGYGYIYELIVLDSSFKKLNNK